MYTAMQSCLSRKGRLRLGPRPPYASNATRIHSSALFVAIPRNGGGKEKARNLGPLFVRQDELRSLRITGKNLIGGWISCPNFVQPHTLARGNRVEVKGTLDKKLAI